jgi:phage repressor protein C with HTH and peptisase S24 domain
VLPVSKTKHGSVIFDGKEWWPASEIAKLPGMPGSRAGIYKMAERQKWPFIAVPGKGSKDGVQHFLLPNEISRKQESAQSADDSAVVIHYSTDTNLEQDENSFHIDQYVNVKGSAGPGQAVDEEVVVQVRVDARILRDRVGNNLNALKIASVSGDSMEPTMSHGDQVVVDTACDRFIDDAIYAIQQSGHLRFKRIKLRLDGSIIVKSDNPIDNDPETYSAEEAEHFKVIGRVIPLKFGKFKV